MLAALLTMAMADECYGTPLAGDIYCALPEISGPDEVAKQVPTESPYSVEVTTTRYGSQTANLTVTIEEHPLSNYGLTFSQTTFEYTDTEPGDTFTETIDVTVPSTVAETAFSGRVRVLVNNGEFEYKDHQDLCLLPDQITVAPDGWNLPAHHDWELTLEPSTVDFDGRKIKEFGPGALDNCQVVLGASPAAKAACEARYGVGSPLCGATCVEATGCDGWFQHDNDDWTIDSNSFTDTVGLGTACADWYQCRQGVVLVSSCTFSIPQTFKMECPSGARHPVDVAGPDKIGGYLDATTIGSSSHGQQATTTYAGGMSTCTCTP